MSSSLVNEMEPVLIEIDSILPPGRLSKPKLNSTAPAYETHFTEDGHDFNIVVAVIEDVCSTIFGNRPDTPQWDFIGEIRLAPGNYLPVIADPDDDMLDYQGSPCSKASDAVRALVDAYIHQVLDADTGCVH